MAQPEIALPLSSRTLAFTNLPQLMTSRTLDISYKSEIFGNAFFKSIYIIEDINIRFTIEPVLYVIAIGPKSFRVLLRRVIR